jgi:polygalacturonase
MFISPINCQGVYIEGVSLENTAFWNIVPVYCDNVIIRGVSINSVGIPRGDGIDVESSKNVLIEYCDLSCGDDCFTLKAGRGIDGLRVNKPTEKIVIRYCLAREGHGGITCGSETAGMIRELYVHDCVFENTGIGIRFKTRRPRGGGGENLYYERIRMNLRYTAVKWDMLGKPEYVGALANRLPKREINELTPKYRNINMSDLYVRKATYFLKVFGIPESPLENFNLKRSEIHCTNLIKAFDLKNMRIEDTKIQSKDSIIELTDARNILFRNVNIDMIDDNPVKFKIEGESSQNVEFNGLDMITK